MAVWMRRTVSRRWAEVDILKGGRSGVDDAIGDADLQWPTNTKRRRLSFAFYVFVSRDLPVVQPGQRRVVVAECKFHPGQVGTGQAATSQLPLFRDWSRRFAGTEH